MSDRQMVSDTNKWNRRSVIKSGGAVGLTGLTGLAGCASTSQSNSNNSQSNSGSSSGKVTWKYATAEQGSGADTEGKALATYFKKYSDNIDISPETTNGYIQNMRLINNHTIDAMFSHTIVAYWAYNNQGPFEKNHIENKPVQGHPTNQVLNHIFLVRKNSELTYVSDLDGQTVAIGAPGSSLGPIAKDILKSAGVLDKVKTQQITFDEARSAFRAKNIDVFFTGIINKRTNSATLKLFQTSDIEILKMKKRSLTNLVKNNPFFKKATVHTDHPKWPSAMDTSYKVLQLPQIVAYGLLDRKLDDKKVYNSLKTIHKHQKNIVEYDKNMGGYGWGKVKIGDKKLDRWGMQGALSSVPFHKGAAKFLKEINKWNNNWKIA